jgi:hypothetical protein
MTRRQTFVATIKEWAGLIGLLGGIATATGMQMVTGGSRITALETRVAALDASTSARITALEGNAVILNAVALDLCLRTTDPRIRAPLECFRRESGR